MKAASNSSFFSCMILYIKSSELEYLSNLKTRRSLKSRITRTCRRSILKRKGRKNGRMAHKSMIANGDKRNFLYAWNLYLGGYFRSDTQSRNRNSAKNIKTVNTSKTSNSVLYFCSMSSNDSKITAATFNKTNTSMKIPKYLSN